MDKVTEFIAKIQQIRLIMVTFFFDGAYSIIEKFIFISLFAMKPENFEYLTFVFQNEYCVLFWKLLAFWVLWGQLKNFDKLKLDFEVLKNTTNQNTDTQNEKLTAQNSKLETELTAQNSKLETELTAQNSKLDTAKLDIYEVAVHQKLLLSFLELNYKQFPAQSLADLKNKLSPKWISYFGLQEKQNSKNQNVIDKVQNAESKLNFEIHELFGKKPKILDEALSDDFLTKRG